MTLDVVHSVAPLTDDDIVEEDGGSEEPVVGSDKSIVIKQINLYFQGVTTGTPRARHRGFSGIHVGTRHQTIFDFYYITLSLYFLCRLQLAISGTEKIAGLAIDCGLVGR